jgi:hypothetical protein
MREMRRKIETGYASLVWYDSVENADRRKKNMGYLVVIENGRYDNRGNLWLKTVEDKEKERDHGVVV